jgi:hypothetical protein
MLLKISQVVALSSAIKSLDGRAEVALDANGKNIGVVVKPYEFENAQVRYALARTQRHLRNTIESYNKDVKEIVHVHSGGKDQIKSGDPAAQVARKEIDLLDDEMHDVTVHTLKLADLKAHDNKLSPDLLCDLDPMIEPDAK